MSVQGFTQEQIAKQLGVTQKTVSKDLENYTKGINQKPAKTASNPKGAGRPKGSKRSGPQPDRRTVAPAVERTAAALVLDEGKTYEQARDELNLKSVNTVKTAVAREEGRREPQVNRNDLSLTAQQKFDTAIRQEKARLQAQWSQAVGERVRQIEDEIILPLWKKQIEEAKTLYERRRGLMDKPTFNAIRRALHPDSRNSISEKVLAAAFDTFMGLEKYLLAEKDSPTEWGDLPSSAAEWDKMRAKTSAKRSGRSNIERRG
jgi:transcriptional regulator with XRE-family HTH domain